MSTDSGQVTLMIITDADKAPTTIRFSRTSFRLLLLALLLLALAIVIGTFTYSRLLIHSAERARLVAEVTELERYTAKVDQLEKNLVAYRQMLKKVTDLAGVDLSEFGVATIDNVDVTGGKVSTTSLAGNNRAHPTPQGYPVNGYVSRSYRPDDENPRMRHFGIDLAVSAGTPVIATADGVVSFAGWDQIFGWKVVMTHADGIETVYGHNDSLLVKVGDGKSFGEVIATSGSTGVSTAPHVHYEIRKNGNPVAPDEYLERRN
jgi:murein DD-endopeptidase MepM/ murein hydrolase activator NlpD